MWLDNEVLYREGLALRLDKGDKAIRERVIFKALSVVDAGVHGCRRSTRPVCASGSRRNRARYDEPARFDFQEAVLAGDPSEAAVRAFAHALNAGTPGDAQAGLRVFTGRPHENIVQSYGAEFAQALRSSPPGRMAGAAERATACARCASKPITPGKPADFEDLRGVRAAGLDGCHDGRAAQRRRARAGEEIHHEDRGRGASDARACSSRWLLALLAMLLLAAPARPRTK